LPWIVGLLAGCSSAAEDAGYDPGAAETHDPTNDDPWAGSGAADGDETGADDDGGESGGGGDSSGDGEGDDAPEPPPSGEDDGTYSGCPRPLPDGWVFCEDFETTIDPSNVVLDYQDLDGAFMLVDEIGASGTHSMQVNYREGEEGAGWMVVSFGASPIDSGERPNYEIERSFEEIYWRLRVKTEPGWPDIGPGQLTRTTSFASADWSEAVVADLRSAGQDVVLEGMAATCVSGGEVACTGFDDAQGLESLGPLMGEAPLFSEAESGQWHCVEGHLVLNTPGEVDGVFEFWVDDLRQAGRDDLDLRGSWTEYGINAVVVENLWPGGAPAPLRRWIDDLVISAEPIGCEPSPDGAVPG